MPETTAQIPPPLTQDPEEASVKPFIPKSQKDSSRQFDATKVLAAIGLILTGTVILVGILWFTIQNLEKRVEELETDVKVTRVENKTSASQAAAKIASRTATKSSR